MAFVVRTRKGRYEIRESTTTPTGPRSRTLAGFTVLDDATLASACARSAGTADAPALRRAARRLGAPVLDAPADTAARHLIGELVAGRRPSPALEALLRRAMDIGETEAAVDVPGDMTLWVDADDEQRGRALVDLLELGDRLPPPKRGALVAPRLAPPDIQGPRR